ncbi:MAG TPA: threonine--tRNA ligase [Patescibacteria group bacterium]|nr:threonine--tRNA ligase [Patescibacteria group bacterium]
MKNEEYLDQIRHSCSHLLTAAIEALYPGVKQTIGPPIENGFYHDYDLGDMKISEDDFPKIEQKMHELVKNWKSFEGREETEKEALAQFKDNEYKQELIREFAKDKQKLTLYTSGGFIDLCHGGHTAHPDEELKYFKLLSVAGAYWRGSEKNKMLTRIYGTCFPTQKKLDDYLAARKLAEESDHRKIGKDLNLFVFSDLVGRGLPLLTPKGSIIRRILERFVVDTEIAWGYSHVYTPPIAKTDLYKTSGHYPYYKDTMYPVMKVDEDELILRPMTCPHHFMLYKSSPRSYKELPLKLAEIAPQFRYEKSGELSGLMRVRTFMLSDSHIFTQKEKAKDVILEVIKLIDYLNGALGFKKGEDYRFRLSLGERNDEKKYYKDDKAWDEAEEVLRSVLKEIDAPYFEAPNEAAFYGPKIDVQIKKVNGQEETAFTVQYDFVMPKRFELTYTNDKGEKEEPVVIHRASIGALERTMAFLIEKYKGAMPLWLSPVQVALIPIAERHNEAAKKTAEFLRKRGVRVDIDDRSESMQAKIRYNTLQKVPYLGIIGDREASSDSISVRTRKGEDLKAMSREIFADRLGSEIEHKL